MIRVLVAVDSGLDCECEAIGSQLLTAGNGQFAAVVHRLPPFGCTPAAVRSVGRLEHRHGFDVVHAIGLSAFLAVAPHGCQPIMFSAPADDLPRAVGRLRLVSRFRSVSVVVTSGAARSFLIEQGIKRETIRTARAQVPATAVSDITRGSLGLAASDKVVLALGESTRPANHRLAIWSAAILNYLDRRHRLLLWGRGPLTEGLMRFADSLGLPGVCVFAEPALGRPVGFAELCPLANAALGTAGRIGPVLPAACCHAAGLPVVAIPSPLGYELTGPSLIAESSRPRPLASTLINLLEQETLPADPPPVGPVTDWAQLYEDALVGRRAEREAVGVTVPCVR